MKSKSKIRTIIGAVIITIAAMILVSCLWSLEEKATQSLEEKAISAAEQENWELAYSYAEEADKSGSTEMLSEIGYRNAEKALQSGEYLSAQEQFEALGAFRDAQERARECRYLWADSLEASGDDSAAKEAFFALIPYSDSLDRYRACCYKLAEQELERGNSREAFLAFSELIPFSNSEERAVAIAIELTGESDPEKAVAFAKGFSEEQWEQIEALGKARDGLRMNYIATGKMHAAILLPDGTVTAFGDNTFGQCSTDSFRNIKAIAAGFQHTLGLRTDGTVAATGDNSCGQCEVGSWTDVVFIACGAWDSYGIRSDGTLLHCGFSDLNLDGWTELMSIHASEISVIGVRKDSTVLCTSDRGRFSGSDYCNAEIAIGSAYALKEDGTVQSNDSDLAEWKNIVALECSATILVGISADGTLEVKELLPVSSSFISQLLNEQKVIGVTCAGTYALILHEDGTISTCGEAPAEISENLSHIKIV